MRLPFVTALSFAETAARLAVLLAAGKVTAACCGPEGLGLLGQWLNLVNIVALIASGTFFTLIVDATARHATDVRRWRPIAATIGLLLAVIGGGLMLIAWLTAPWVAARLIGDASAVWVLRVLAMCVVPLLVFHALAAMMMGAQRFGWGLGMRICASVVSFGVCIWLGLRAGPAGAALAVVAGPTLAGCAAVTVSRPLRRLAMSMLPVRASVEPAFVRRAGVFVLMGAVSAISLPLAVVAGRDALAATAGWAEVGYWEVAYRIGELTTLFGTAALGAYFLPRLAVADGPAEIRSLTLRMAAIALAMLAVAAAALLGAPRLWIGLFYAPSAYPAEQILSLQLAGSALRLIAWTMAIQLQLQARLVWYVVAEIGWVAVFLMAASPLSAHLGLRGLAWAYFLANAAYLALVTMLFDRVLAPCRPAQAT